MNDGDPSTELRSRLAALPKADLHIHLEGTVTPATLHELAGRNGIDLHSPVEWTNRDGSPLPTIPPPNPEWLRSPFEGSFPEFIRHYVKISSTIRTASDLELIAARYVAAALRDGVVHAEMYVTPTTLLLLGLPEEELIEGLLRGQAAAVSRGLRLRFIFDIVRNARLPGGWTLEVAERGRSAGVDVCAIGLAGYELGNPASRYREDFARARQAGFRILCHAGETDGAHSIRDALDALEPERIGHGVRAIEDDALLEELCRLQIPLEVCPWSNIRLGVATADSHPLPELVRRGAAVVLCSDDPGIFGSTLTDEYLYAVSRGISEEALMQIAARSLELAR